MSTVGQPAAATTGRGGELRAPLVTLAAGLILLIGVAANPTVLLAYDEQRVLQVVLVLVVTLGLLIEPGMRGRITAIATSAPRALGLAGVAVALGLLSAALSVDPATGLLELALTVSMLLVALAVAAEVRRDATGTSIAIVLLVTAAVAAQLVVTATSLPLDGALEPLWTPNSGDSGFNHPRFLNQFQAAALPVVATVAAATRGPVAVRVVAAALVVLSSWSLVLVEGRGAMLSLVAVVIAVGIVHERDGRRWAAAMGTTFLVGAAAAIASRPLLGLTGFLVSDDLTQDSGRFELWSGALDRIRESPLLGIGPGLTAHVEELGDGLAHPHDMPLQVLSEWGLVAGAIIVGLFVVGGWRLLFDRTPVADTRVLGIPAGVLRAGVAGSVGASLVLSLFSGQVVMPVPQLLLALTGGWAIGLRHAGADAGPGAPVDRSADDAPPTTAARGRLVGVGLAVVAVACSAVLLDEVSASPVERRFDELVAYYDAEGDGAILDPRFWLMGTRGLDVEPGAAREQGFGIDP